MGLKHSVYEKTGSFEYISMTPEEQMIIKDIWSGIDRNPHLHGIAFFTGLLEKYPQYVKYFTLEFHGPLDFDPRTTVKFTMIMEAMGYLLLDFHKKPKEMAKLIGYVAMVHKDMHLDNQDMFNFGFHLLEYLVETFPLKMTMQGRDAMKKFLLYILETISIKMDQFRNYEKTTEGVVTASTQLPCGECMVFVSGNGMIFGKPVSYWEDRKTVWAIRQDEWQAQNLNRQTPFCGYSTEEEDEHGKLKWNQRLEGKTKTVSKYGRENGERLKNEASKATLMALVRKLNTVDSVIDDSSGNVEKKSSNDRSPPSLEDQRPERYSYTEGMTPRERHRARSLVLSAGGPHLDATVLRRRVWTNRFENVPPSTQNDNSEADVQSPRRLSNTARERRRETICFI